MESAEPLLVLHGTDRRLVIGEEFWNDVVSWAIEHGWVIKTPAAECRLTFGDRYSPEEAARLAEALDIIGGNLILHSPADVAESFIDELADALRALQRFAESGGFSVQLSEELPEFSRN